MTVHTRVFHLKVQQFDRVCLFELSWGKGQQLCATVNYLESLTTLYQDWQQAYLNFYTSQQFCTTLNYPESLTTSNLRGRVAESGSLASRPFDWRARLRHAENKLLDEFHLWLRSAELCRIRDTLASAVRNLALAELDRSCVDIFVTCSSIDLARLPWEAWEIGTDFPATGKIQIARTAINRVGPVPQHLRRRQPRILVIWGDNTKLNFEKERKALRSLRRIADVEFVGWQPGDDIATLKAKICEAIADAQGWDVLFFAGHSDENEIAGGELAIAPGIWISIKEISRELTKAKERGLQFAIFNSCKGLSIAESLIDLGLSQVAVMREPIHNLVAEKFLVGFLQELAKYKDVHDALLEVCTDLKSKCDITYPSAYLIPSLFRHPGTELFRIKPSKPWQILKNLVPTRKEAIALSSLLLLGLLPPVQNLLLEPRLWAQAVYRDVTKQLPPVAPPPVLLVQIDQKSFRATEISSLNLIDRSYLSRLVDKIQALNTKVVGVDYLLDYQQPGKDQILAQSIRQSVKRGTWFVFAAQQTAEGEVGVGAETGIASPYWSLQGDINTFPWYVELLPANASCSQSCPFAHLLALVHALNQEPSTPDSPQPQLQSQIGFRSQLIDYLNHESKQNSTDVSRIHQSRLHPITSFSQDFGQVWLQPILDFSIPPNRVYDTIAAWQLLERSQEDLKLRHQEEQPVVIIAPGGYDQAGVKTLGDDNFPVPMAIGYWRERLKAQGNSTSSPIGDRDRALSNPQVFTGAEAQAYMLDHQLKQRLVVPIPDLWMVVVAVLLGKGTLLFLKHQRHRRKWAIILVIANAGYGLAGLQVYISAAVLLPWLLPSAAFWVCVLPAFSRKKLYA